MKATHSSGTPVFIYRAKHYEIEKKKKTAFTACASWFVLQCKTVQVSFFSASGTYTDGSQNCGDEFDQSVKSYYIMII